MQLASEVGKGTQLCLTFNTKDLLNNSDAKRG
jgi:hypothetical protein